MDEMFLRHEAYANLILAGLWAVVAIVFAVKSRETSRLTTVCWLVASVAVIIVALLALQGLLAPRWLDVSRNAVIGILLLWSGVSGFSCRTEAGLIKMDLSGRRGSVHVFRSQLGAESLMALTIVFTETRRKE